MSSLDDMIGQPDAGGPPIGILRRTRSRRRSTWRPPVTATFAIVYLIVLVLAAVLAPVILPRDPNAQNLLNTFQPPHWGPHPLGTDEYGRDELTRLIYGARVSLIAASIGVGVALLVGAPAGIFAGFFGGKAEAVGNFVFEAFMSVPAIIFVLTVVAVFGSGIVVAMCSVGVVISPLFYRLARAATLDVRHETFVEASRAIGCKRSRTIRVHILPHTLTPLVIQTAVVFGLAIVAEAAISYLGLGVQPPTASWGSMLTDAQKNLFRGAYLVYIPGIAIGLTVLSFALIGDWLREVVSTRRRTG